MADESTQNEAEVAYTQLTQVRVPLEQAGEAFSTRDASGRIPIVLIPKQLNRISNGPVIAGVVVLLGAILVHLLANQPILIPIGIVLAILLIIVGVYRSFIVRVPEGANALLAKGGRYTKTIGSGTHIIQPVIVVTHLVTRREIPFDVPVVEAPTKDNVRASVDTLVTFNIVDPFKFVFSISADDFDQVFQAACQDGLRHLVRTHRRRAGGRSGQARSGEIPGRTGRGDGIVRGADFQDHRDLCAAVGRGDAIAGSAPIGVRASSRTGREASAGAAPPKGSGRSGTPGSDGPHRTREGTAAVEDSRE